MNTNIIPFDQASPAAYPVALSQLDEVLAQGLDSGALRLVANQGRFRIKDGQTETVLPDLTLDVIVVGALPGSNQVFYIKKWTPGQEPVAPDCSSLYGDKPDPGVSAPQAATCAECPQNAWGSAVTEAGKEVKACSQYQRIAVVSVDDPSTVYQMNIPPGSLTHWKKFRKEQAMHGRSISRLVIRVSLEEHQWVFAAIGYYSPEVAAQLNATVGTPLVDDALGIFGRAPRAPALAAPAKPVAAIAAPAVVAPAPVVAAPPPAAEPAKPARGFGKKPAAVAAAPVVSVVSAPPAGAATVVVAGANTGLEDLAAELGNLLNGTADV